jgi:hypothetical protein
MIDQIPHKMIELSNKSVEAVGLSKLPPQAGLSAFRGPPDGITGKASITRESFSYFR